jgi:hypothetical protein
MDDQAVGARRHYRTRYRTGRWGCGCASFFLVLTVGIVLSLFHSVVGIGVSVRVPFTQSNFTIAGSIGAKDRAVGALPNYTEGRLGGNQNFFNNSTTMTIGPAEGTVVVIVGRQDGAPPIDLHLVLE